MTRNAKDRTTRRAVLTGAVTATAAAALTAVPALADMADAELLARAAEFATLYRENERMSVRARALRDEADADPACPSLVTEHARWHAFMESRGVLAAYDARDAMVRRAGEAGRAIFAIPARTPAGILAKLRVVHLAYGDGTGADDDLECYQYSGTVSDEDDDVEGVDLDQSWLALAIADLERIVDGRAV